MRSRVIGRAVRDGVLDTRRRREGPAIEHGDAMPPELQRQDEGAADEPVAADDEDFHGESLLER